MSDVPSLRHLITEEDLNKELFGIRAFPMREQYRDPTNNWGMDFGMELPPTWLQQVHNAYAGKRCFMLGTGPSLKAQLALLPKLAGEYTFTCNRMKLWGELPFTPFVHCVTEPNPVINFGQRIKSLYDFPGAKNKVACIWWPVTAKGWLWMPKASDDIQVRWNGTWGLGDHLPPVPTAWASPLTITQLALWMGFSEVYLLGVDTTQQGQAWDVDQGRTAKPRSIRSILECAERMSRDIKRSGRQFWDCTPGGRLNREGAIAYRSLEEVLG